MFELFQAALLVAAATDPTPAQLINPDQLVTPDDYPAIAVVEGQEGTTAVRLRINSGGLVESCQVIKSSGHSVLDEQSCAVYGARARFRPARDHGGQATESDYTQSVKWELAEDPPPPMPREAWMTRSILGRTADNKVVDCKVESVGLSQQLGDCKELFEVAKAGGFLSGKNEPVAGHTITETHFYPVPAGQVETPALLADAQLLGRQVSEIVIGRNGRVNGCKALQYFGNATPSTDACPFLKSRRFAPVASKGSLAATVVMTVYERSISLN